MTATMTPTEMLHTALDLGIFACQGASERDSWCRVFKKMNGKLIKKKADLDVMVEPLVTAGLMRIDRNEMAIKGCPGGTPRPATTVRTFYRLTTAGSAARMAWKLANLNHPTIGDWERHVLTQPPGTPFIRKAA